MSEIIVTERGAMLDMTPYHVTCSKARRKRQRRYKWINVGCMWRSCWFRYPDEVTEITIFELSWYNN